MDIVHEFGIDVIIKLQTWLQDFSGLMFFLSYVGHPAFAFTFFFPIAYCIHPSVGKRLLWVAIVTEWLNAILKWILHGERPYWWVHESNYLLDVKPPHIQQFNITCEVGPGSPSGHAMVSTAVMYIIVSDFIYYKEIKGICSRLLCWSVYAIVNIGICISRLYIAAHFPHQVIAGFAAGVILARYFNTVSMSNLQLKHYLYMTVAMVVITFDLYYIIFLLSFDPFWSVALARRWCLHSEWIHINSSLFYAIVRDFAHLLALGFASWFIKYWKVPVQRPVRIVALQIVLSLTLITICEHLKVPSSYTPIFYTVSFFKHFSTIVILILLVSQLSMLNV